METSQNKSPSEGTDFKELRLLEELEETPQITQRKMADRLGIALGVANLLTKNLIKKGYVRATKVGWRRWVYTLTPEGFTRKLQLTRQYVDRTIDHYRRIKLLLRAELDFAEIGTGSRVGIVGKSELSEIVYLALGDLGVTKIGFFDDKFVGNKMFNLVIKKESDLSLIKNIISRADVFIQNLAPGVSERVGLGSEFLRDSNSRLITCDISGYGQNGEYRDM